MANEVFSLTAMKLGAGQSAPITAVLLREGLGRQHPLTLAQDGDGRMAQKNSREASLEFGMS
jgi:hypothetical protein